LYFGAVAAYSCLRERWIDATAGISCGAEYNRAMNRYCFLAVFPLLWLLCVPQAAYAYAVGPPLTLKQEAAQADLVVKAQAVSSNAAQDAWLGETSGTTAEETRFRVISPLKGNPACSIIVFRHYTAAPTNERFSMGPGPLCYQFQPGRAYIIFAKTTREACTFRQIWKYPPGWGSGQGVLRCADTQPLKSGDLHLAAWHELTGLLQSPRSEDKLYALPELDNRSGASQTFMATEEFDRDHVLASCAPLLRDRDPEVVIAALGVIADHSPYLRDEYGTNWSPRRYIRPEFKSSLPPLPAHVAAERAYSLQILSLASNSPDISVRALAIRALSTASLSDAGSLPNLRAATTRWANDPQLKVRAAAALRLGGDFSRFGQALLQKLSQDPEPFVRRAAARGISLAKNAAAIPLLPSLLRDTNLDVREAAASSLASFPAAQVRAVLLANRTDPEFKSIFVDVLAENNPAPYLNDLLEIISKQLAPPQFCGNLPDYEAWDLAFKSLSSQPQTNWNSSQWTHDMDILEMAIAWENSAPFDLYTFYVSHGLKERAIRLRKLSKKLITWDIENNFNTIDAETPFPPQSP